MELIKLYSLGKSALDTVLSELTTEELQVLLTQAGLDTSGEVEDLRRKLRQFVRNRRKTVVVPPSNDADDQEGVDDDDDNDQSSQHENEPRDDDNRQIPVTDFHADEDSTPSSVAYTSSGLIPLNSPMIVKVTSSANEILGAASLQLQRDALLANNRYLNLNIGARKREIHRVNTPKSHEVAPSTSQTS